MTARIPSALRRFKGSLLSDIAGVVSLFMLLGGPVCPPDPWGRAMTPAGRVREIGRLPQAVVAAQDAFMAAIEEVGDPLTVA